MRKIKFRAKRIDNGEWICGDLQQNIDAIKIREQEKDIDGKTLDRIAKSYVVDKNTISQFIGLYDKNRKEIYENDIVKAKYIEKRDFGGIKYDNEMEFNELVVWKYQAFQLEIDNCGIKMYRHLNFYEDLNNIKLKEIEVIGNIFDNPELLEK